MGRFIDLTGQKFGRLTVIARAENDKDNKAQWLCRCDCGAEKIVSRSHLKSGAVKSCGCLNAPDMIGQVYGRLTVLSYADVDKPGRYCKCKCSCGNIKVVRATSLVSGEVKSCGCYNYEVQTSQHKHNRYEICGEVTIMYTMKDEPFLIDTEDLDRVKKICWFKGPRGELMGKQHMLLHRYIMNASDNELVDHKHGNPSDNRKSELRICSYAENNRNRKQLENTISGVTGVYLEPDGKWRARITYNGKRIHLGRFTSKDAAIAARYAAEDKYFGEFSRRRSRGK